MIPQYESTGEWVQRIEEQKRSQPSKKQCKHENLLVVPSNGKRICEDCGYIIQGFKKSSEPAKKPTGILKDLSELKRYEEDYDGIAFEHEYGSYVLWSDVEAIINKYMNP